MDNTLKIIDVKPVTEVKKDPQLVMEPIPCLSPIVGMVWPVIKPYVKELADASMGDFTEYDVRKELFFGSAELIMGYRVDDIEAYNQGKQTNKTFMGYVITRMEKTAIHIWQVYILPEFRNTNALEIGHKWIEEKARETGAKYMTISANRNMFGSTLPKMGYSETFTLYRKNI